WRYYRLTIFWIQYILRSKHKNSCFCLCFSRKWYVDCHLGSIKVSVICCTNKRVYSYRSTLYQRWLKCLNNKSEQSEGTDQEYCEVYNHMFKYIPHLLMNAFNFTFCRFDIVGNLLSD